MCESVCIFMTFYDFYCVLLYFLLILSVCLSVWMSLCVCVWAMLPDSNKMMMMMMIVPVNKLLHRKSSSPLPTNATTSPGTSLVDSFASFFHRQNIPTPSFSHQQPCYIISALTLSSCYSPWLLSFHSCLVQNPKSTRFCPTIQTSNLIQVQFPPGD